MDLRLHADRLDGKRKRTYRADVATLPDGAYVAIDDRAWLIWDGAVHEWSGSGYGERRPRPMRGAFDVLTPRCTVAVFSAGYRPAIHPALAV
jgi:hypothetical protein